MNGDLQLDSLLRALRAAGLSAGISEILRLRQVFVCPPSLDGGEISRKRLRSLLRAVLVKSAEDRSIFDRTCDAWLDRAEEALELQPARQRLVLPPKKAQGFRWLKLLGQTLQIIILFLGLIVAKGTGVQKSVILEPQISFSPIPAQSPVGEGTQPGPGTVPVQETPTPVPTQVEPRSGKLDVLRRAFETLLTSIEVTVRPEMSLAVLAWLVAGGLWLVLRRRRLLPNPVLAAPAAGPPRAFPIAVPSAGAVLLAPRDQESLAWGISRFVAEESTRRLDLPATVRATALAGGLPEMRFHRARFYREVWLWVDEDADDPALPRLAEEIEAVLAAHGLPVERAAFRGVPYRLVTTSGQVFAPNEIDERRDVALVAVLTDGRRLVRRWAADDQRVRIDALLRSLSHWPHIAFVGASREGEDLAAILGRHGLTMIAPERAATFLGGGVMQRSAPRPTSGPDQVGEAAWAAACALSPSSVDEITALELRSRLGFAASPYSLQALRAEAPGPPGRLAWRAADRIRRVSWLREAEAHPAGAVLPESLLGRALDFWEGVYDQSLRKHAERAGEGDRAETPAERFLRMEQALLGLWRKPGDHITELYRLYQGPLQEAIKQRCEVLASADWGGAGVIHLPWTWSERTPVERAMLQDMGLGGGMPPVVLRRPGRAWLGLGLLAGLGLAAAGMAALQDHRVDLGLNTSCTNQEIEENGFAFVRICPNMFLMGSKAGDPLADQDEWPVHRVTLDEFWISKFEVTNEQYRRFHPDHNGEPNLPVSGVSWIDARDFCEKLGYRLPTEAEWEYAARAGTDTQWSFGSDQGGLDRFAWFENTSGNQTHPVGLKAPNPWGLHDMHGNVWEWVGGWYGAYSAEPQVNPQGPSRGELRVVRGGSYLNEPLDLRSANRNSFGPDDRVGVIGFRCVRDPRRQP